MKPEYTYKDLERGRITSLLGGLIRELTWQDKMYLIDVETKQKTDYNETTDILIDKIECMEDGEYEEFINKLTEVLY